MEHALRFDDKLQKELCRLSLSRNCSFEFGPDFWNLTCSSLTQEQCQYDRAAHFTKNSLSGRPLGGGLASGSAGLPSGPSGSSAGSGGSPHVQCRIFWTFPLRGGHWGKHTQRAVL